MKPVSIGSLDALTMIPEKAGVGIRLFRRFTFVSVQGPGKHAGRCQAIVGYVGTYATHEKAANGLDVTIGNPRSKGAGLKGSGNGRGLALEILQQNGSIS